MKSSKRPRSPSPPPQPSSSAAVLPPTHTRSSAADVSFDSLSPYRLSQLPDSEFYYLSSLLSLPSPLSITSNKTAVVAEDERTKLERWYKDLMDSCPWYHPTLKLYGKPVLQSRAMAVYSFLPSSSSPQVRYSGIDAVVHPFEDAPEALREIKEVVERTCGMKFEHAMVNRYDDGSVYIGPHRDVVPKLPKTSKSKRKSEKAGVTTKRQKVSVSSVVEKSVITKGKGSVGEDEREEEGRLDEAEDGEEETERFTVVSLSLGAARTFVLKHQAPPSSVPGSKASKPTKSNKKSSKSSTSKSKLDASEPSTSLKAENGEEAEKEGEERGGKMYSHSFPLEDGSLLIMRGGETQKWWKHEIPREKGVMRGRISVTMRGGVMP
ncbi:hypothetical protein BT69DRAFT_1347487 [Atractiella rhizophila]|nr:hypothetical protein BT69DRAFT_1347487 [Atractiella rhizophila]